MLREKTLYFADGGSRGTTITLDDGGWGLYIVRPDGSTEQYNGYQEAATNNMMEIKAMIKGMSLVRSDGGQHIFILDSTYVCNCLNQRWYEKWEDNGWITSGGQPVKNKELWIELVEQFRQAQSKGVDILIQHINSHIPKSSLVKSDKDFVEYNKFIKKNGYITRQEFEFYIKGNNKADSLATQGMDKYFVEESNTKKIEVITDNEPKRLQELWCIVGKSGSGKTAIERVLSEECGIDRVISATTRPPRQEEENGVDYYFISREEFEGELNKFVEYMYLASEGLYWGTPVSEMNCRNGEVKTVVANPMGFRQLKMYCLKNNIKLRSVYLDIDWRIRAKRMLDRGDEQTEFCRRLIYDDGMFAGLENEVDSVYKVDKDEQVLPIKETALEIKNIFQNNIK